MGFSIDRRIENAEIDEVDRRTRAALEAKGFGVLTAIDVQATMKRKLDADMAGYRILGACNPRMAWEAISLEPRAGALLPCNIILRQVEGAVEVSAVNPVATTSAVCNDDLRSVAEHVRGMLADAVKSI